MKAYLKKGFSLALAMILAGQFLLPVSAAVTDPASMIDSEGPSYEGTVILAQNMDFGIGSDEELETLQATGLENMSDGQAEELSDAELPEAAAKPRCGLSDLPHRDMPALNTDMPASRNIMEYQVGDTKTIHTDYALDGSTEFTAEVAAVGESCTIWRNVEERDLLTDAQAKAYADAIDTQIIGPMKKAFGDWSAADVDQDGKVAFAFYKIPYAGFFDTADLFTKEETEYATGNVMDMLHMDITCQNTQTTLGTLAHELQHLINFAQTDGNCDIWLNEVFSQSAIAITDLASSDTVYETEWTTQWISKMGYSYPFIYEGWYVSSGDTLGMPYGSWYLFGRYLSHQTEGLSGGGDALFQTILEQMRKNPQMSSLGAVEEALRQIGYFDQAPQTSCIEDVITNYNLALYLRDTEGIYSLSQNAADPDNVDGVAIGKILETDTAPEALPGGGAACWVLNKSENESVTPEGAGADVRFAGISRTFLSGVYTDALPDVLTWGQEINLYTDDPKASIYYTTDGTDPRTGGEKYESPLKVQEPMYIRACTRNESGGYSRILELNIENVKVSRVNADTAAGRVEPGTKVALSCDTPGAQIIYTTDGSQPSKSNGNTYQDPITVDQTMTIKAIAILPDQDQILPGDIRTFVYETSGDAGDRYEPDDTLEEAVSLSFPGRIEGTIHEPEDVDYYAFTLEQGAGLSLTLTPPTGKDYSLTLLDANGKELKQSAISGSSQNIRYEAGAGTYFVKIASAGNDASAKESYQLSLMKELDPELVEDLDLSEKNMLTALTDKDSGYAYDLGVDGGGNFLMSMAYFANWDGPVDETWDPYPEHEKEDQADYSYQDLSDKAMFHVQNTLYLPNGSNEDFISHLKNAVYNYGAADIYVLASYPYMTPDLKNWYIDDAYEYHSDYDGGHIVTVVGWDDNYSKENFKGWPEIADEIGIEDYKPVSPENDGAFIIKNSWGEEAGEDGYFYLSYEDAFFRRNNPAVYLADEASDNYNHQYYNDLFGAVDGISAENSFTAEENFTNTTETAELLQAVSIQLFSANTRYEIRVTCEGTTKKVAEGVKTYGGFYTVRLSEPVMIPAGADFSVSVYLENTEGGESPMLGVSMNYPEIVSGVVPQAGVAYLEQNGVRTDLGAVGCYPCIRAYTRNVDLDTYAVTTAEPDEKGVSSLSDPAGLEGIETGGVEYHKENGTVTVDIPSANLAKSISTEGLPDQFDLRETGTLTPVRNQGNLGSCWTFAAMASVENTYVRSGGYLEDHPKGLSLDVSSQQIVLNKEEPEQAVSLTAELTGSSSPSSAKIYWSISGDTDSVRLEQTESFTGEKVQVLTALKPGTVTVTAASDADMNLTAQCLVTITSQGVESITLDPQQLTLKKGESRKIQASTSPENAFDTDIVWSSDHPEIASVDDEGNVTALSGGTATITAQAGSAKAQTVVTVEGKAAVNPGAGDESGTGSSTTESGNARTGDSSHAAAWILLAVISAAVIWGRRPSQKGTR